ncbi:hypothetical protein PMIN07_012650 [Paraphaeosphaeria minitans]
MRPCCTGLGCRCQKRRELRACPRITPTPPRYSIAIESRCRPSAALASWRPGPRCFANHPSFHLAVHPAEKRRLSLISILRRTSSGRLTVYVGSARLTMPCRTSSVPDLLKPDPHVARSPTVGSQVRLRSGSMRLSRT